jgi:RNA polymerase sigma factor (sigma-70 family)
VARTEPSSAFADRFGLVYEDEVWSVYGFIAYRVNSREEAEDLTQLTFERALKAFDRYDETRASVRTWLLAIARNLVIDHFRRDGGLRADPLEELIEEDRNVPASLVQHDTTDLGLSPEIEDALSELSQRDREVVALRFGAELTGREIAHLTDLSLGNVQQILSRSLRRMRARIESAAIGDY